ncbi:MAG: histidine phosphatase family protein [Alphaproteobacteria bacterium]
MQPRITLISPATTKALRAATFGGDGPLDDLGRSQAERLSGVLGQVDQCWTSPAQAARETAQALGLSAMVDDTLRDCDYGRWKGLKFQQVLLKEPVKLVAWMKNPSGAPHGGETIDQVLARVTAWLTLRGAAKGHTVAITHPAVIRAAVVHVLEAGPQSFWRVDIVPLAKVDLRTNGRRWVLRSIAPLAPADDTLPEEMP